MDADRVRAALLSWYRHARRDLPWRATRDPYAVLVAEVMLQQTRVEQALPYYRRFLSRFPTVGHLAAADPDEVLAGWEGLGYYRRALQLHAAAREMAARYGGRVPDDEEALRSLPGIGPYTAAAVLSIAYGRPRPALDGNALRVLARLTAEAEPIDRADVRERLRRVAERLLCRDDPGGFNQALMELGATVCLPRRPRCGDCPLAPACAARAAGLADRLPRRRPRAAPAEERRVAALARDGAGRVLLGRRPPGGLLGGLWELPAAAVGGAAELARYARERWGLPLEPGPMAGELELRFSHRVWRVEVFRACAPPGLPPPREGAEYVAFAWADLEAPAAWPMPPALRRWLQENHGR